MYTHRISLSNKLFSSIQITSTEIQLTLFPPPGPCQASLSHTHSPCFCSQHVCMILILLCGLCRSGLVLLPVNSVTSFLSDLWVFSFEKKQLKLRTMRCLGREETLWKMSSSPHPSGTFNVDTCLGQVCILVCLQTLREQECPADRDTGGWKSSSYLISRALERKWNSCILFLLSPSVF